jgi:hypothetical protein
VGDNVQVADRWESPSVELGEDKSEYQTRTKGITYPLTTLQPILNWFFQKHIGPPCWNSDNDTKHAVDHGMHACVQTTKDYGHDVYDE